MYEVEPQLETPRGDGTRKGANIIELASIAPSGSDPYGTDGELPEEGEGLGNIADPPDFDQAFRASHDEDEFMTPGLYDPKENPGGPGANYKYTDSPSNSAYLFHLLFSIFFQKKFIVNMETDFIV